MATLSLEQSLELSELCKTMISFNPGISGVAIINKNGRILTTKFRNDSIIKNLSPQEIEMLCMQRVLQTSMNKELNEKLGTLRFTISYRCHLLELIIPFNNGIVLITLDHGLEIQNTINQIEELIKEFELQTIR